MNFRQILEEDEEEDVLSEAESKGYPSEVRDWLTMTFTRSLTNIKRRQDKLHFRGVANAIRAGIVVDRYYDMDEILYMMTFDECRREPGHSRRQAVHGVSYCYR